MQELKERLVLCCKEYKGNYKGNEIKFLQSVKLAAYPDAIVDELTNGYIIIPLVGTERYIIEVFRGSELVLSEIIFKEDK